MQSIKSIAELLTLAEKNYQNPKAMADKIKGEWVFTSQEQLIHEVKALALWLTKHGVKKGDNVGILALPSARWTIVDLASMVIGAVTVPLFGNVSSENFEYETDLCDIKLIFVSGDQEWKMWDKFKDRFTTTIALDKVPSKQQSVSYEKVIEEGENLLDQNPTTYQELLSRVRPDDLATIIFTSGSTGVPKGVMLTHQNLVAITHVDPMHWNRETDRYLSILPLAHVFGRSLNFIMLHWGIPVYYFNELKQVGVACQEIHPTIVALVPRLLEKIYAKMVDKVNSAGFLKRTIGQWAFNLANDEDDEGLYKTLMQPLADKIVYSQLREKLGGELRVVISGGAPLNPHLCHFFIDIGMPIYEGFGMTEASITTCNNPEMRKVGSVGRPLETMKVKTSDEGELLIKGPIVMQGYYKRPDATEKTFTEDGWFKTGDKAVIDEQGFVTIVGRVKELIKSSVGEWIAPVPIEQQLGRAPIVDMAMVVAYKRKFASCVLFPDFEVLETLKKSQGCESMSDDEFLNSEFVQNEMRKVIDSINQHLNHWEQIRDFRFIPNPPTIETGELTPSMKIRREVVTEKYKALIDSMYLDEANV
ncbi:MAG: long-chain fatty acid--CoA ligase [Chlamydiia bacterium]|nr:long-chain fatty acid--CoA ligase [Chlamydiia bacterium]